MLQSNSSVCFAIPQLVVYGECVKKNFFFESIAALYSTYRHPYYENITIANYMNIDICVIFS